MFGSIWMCSIKKKKVVTLGSEGGGVPWGGALHQIWLTNCCKLHPDIRPNVQTIERLKHHIVKLQLKAFNIQGVSKKGCFAE